MATQENASGTWLIEAMRNRFVFHGMVISTVNYNGITEVDSVVVWNGSSVAYIKLYHSSNQLQINGVFQDYYDDRDLWDATFAVLVGMHAVEFVEQIINNPK